MIRVFMSLLILVLALPGCSSDPSAPAPFTSLTLLQEWGGQGEGSPFFRPRAIDLAPDGTVFIVDGNGQSIHSFTREGEHRARWLQSDRGGPFNDITDLALDGEGHVYVVERRDNRIRRIDGTGRLRAIWGGEGSEPGQFLYPTGVAVDEDRRVYVADPGNRRIQVFSGKDGAFLNQWSTVTEEAGDYTDPFWVAVRGERVVVLNRLGLGPPGPGENDVQVQVFTREGVRTHAWGRRGPGPGEIISPDGLAIGPDGSVYISEPTQERLQRFTPGGTLLEVWNTESGGHSGLYGIAVDEDGGVLATDLTLGFVLEFTPAGELVRRLRSSVADGRMVGPKDVEVDGEGNVYILDQAKGIQKFTPEGTFVLGWDPYRVTSIPIQMDVDGAGHVYTTVESKIHKFSTQGEFLDQWPDPPASDQGLLCGVSALAVNAAGNVYLSESFRCSGRVYKFADAGRFLHSWEGRSEDAVRLRILDLAADDRNRVYLVDSQNHRIQKFTGDGTFVTQWGSEGTGEGQFLTPSDIAVSESGLVYVADAERRDVQVFTGNGHFVTSHAIEGAEAEGSPLLTVAADREGNVFVADYENDRILKLGPAAPNP